VFAVPRRGRTPSLRKLVAAREACEALDWKLHDVTLSVVAELPEEVSSRHRVARTTA
jgi:hypothetical protein